MLENERSEGEAESASRQANGARSGARGESGADGVRVSADEFNAALRAIEQRRAKAAEHRAGTVDISETIRDLGIDATPDEILAEIEAERARRGDEERAKSDLRAKAQRTASDAWDYASGAFETIRQRMDEAALKTGAQRRHGRIAINVNIGGRPRSHAGRDGFGRLVAIVALLWFAWSMAGGRFMYGLPALVRAIGGAVSSGPATVVPLGKAQSGKTVYCDPSNLIAIMKAGGTVSASDGSVETLSTQQDNTWPIVIHDGDVYVRGYMQPSAAEDMNSRSVDILNDDNAGELAGQADDSVTVPLKGAKLLGSAVHGGWSQITLSGIVPDRYTTVADD